MTAQSPPQIRSPDAASPSSPQEDPPKSTALLDIGAYLIEETATSAKEHHKKTAVECLAKYVDGAITYKEACDIFIALINTKAPLERIDTILKTSDDPIQCNRRSSTLKNGRNESRIWTKYEDQRLVCGIHKFGEDWVRVARFVGNNRNKVQCSQRWCRSLNPTILKGPWSFEENKLLIELVEVHGDRNWKKVAAVLTKRTDAQCRYRYIQLKKTGELDIFKNHSSGSGGLSQNLSELSPVSGQSSIGMNSSSEYSSPTMSPAASSCQDDTNQTNLFNSFNQSIVSSMNQNIQNPSMFSHQMSYDTSSHQESSLHLSSNSFIKQHAVQQGNHDNSGSTTISCDPFESDDFALDGWDKEFEEFCFNAPLF
ncbi:Myb-like DNA-binding domain containing protein [Tritrichomonas foetus]|uniref:Myb-like DNA-binding domain containing protein n=1 Tax=Tritrichomonas foetus TaxID=1144522 RepID=A0A1J4JBL8_9EUKA|nr:Myb-like DNA-binding domain containing protein [Tritrichomonas foetus]|eukprot:OHS96574.1 Myb-like DNA-binding domain containing protein [Tritrichomonas foetus]